MKVLNLTLYPIYDMLKIEEAIMRNSKSNWLILNHGTSTPSIIMGISGKPEKLLDVPLVRKHNVKVTNIFTILLRINHLILVFLQVIRRFSGGGTVFVDNNTLFCSLIGSKSILARQKVTPYPKELMQWTWDAVYK